MERAIHIMAQTLAGSSTSAKMTWGAQLHHVEFVYNNSVTAKLARPPKRFASASNRAFLSLFSIALGLPTIRVWPAITLHIVT